MKTNIYQKTIIAILTMFFAVCLSGSKTAFATTGTSGSCPYEIDDDSSTLIIGDGTYCELGDNTSSSPDFYPWHDDDSIFTVTVKPNVVAASNSSYLFSDLPEAMTFNLTNLNTSNVTNMFCMFAGTNSNRLIFTLNLSGWDTSNVTNMSYMFSTTGGNATYYSLNLSGWNTSKVTNMSGMFSSTGGIGATDDFRLYLSGWDTSNVTDMSNMFQVAGLSAKNWVVSGISSWNTSKVTNMRNMFAYAGRNSSSDLSFDLSNWNTGKVTNMNGMFTDVPIGELILGPGTNNLNSSTNLGTNNFLKSIDGDIHGVFTGIKDIPDAEAFWTEVPTITRKHTFTNISSIGDTNSIVLDANGGTLSPLDVPSTAYTLAGVTPTAAMIKEAGITATKPSHNFVDWTLTNTDSNTYKALANYILTPEPTPEPIPTPETFSNPNTGVADASSQDNVTNSILSTLTFVTIVSSGYVIIRKQSQN